MTDDGAQADTHGDSRRGSDCARGAHPALHDLCLTWKFTRLPRVIPNAPAPLAAKYNIPRVHGSYDALLADPDLDAIYNPLPNSLHALWTIKALQAGKHVLCEKPLASNATEAESMSKVAQETGLVLSGALPTDITRWRRRCVT